MIIGNFTYDAENDHYLGDIKTLTVARSNLVLRPQRKGSEREPDYRVFEETPSGTVELGAAWRRRSDKGQSFLSVTLDDPTFAHAMNVALFDDRDGKATLVWTRQRSKGNEAEPNAAAQPTGRPARPPRAARLG